MSVQGGNARTLINKLMCGIQLVDRTILQLYSSFTGSFDHVIAALNNMPTYLKKILHSKQIVFFVFLLCNFLLLNTNTKISNYTEDLETHLYLIKLYLYYAFILFFLAILFLICVLKFRKTDDMFIKRYEDLEEYIQKHNKDLVNNQCNICKITRPMRSFHCQICNKCVTRYDRHSNWFNTCIGALNALPYLIILILHNFYLLLVMLNIIFQIFCLGRSHPLYNFKNKEFIFYFWLVLTIYISIKNFYITKEFFNSAVKNNLTSYEASNWRRLPYLWSNMRKEYFNPFNKGAKANFKELIKSFINREISISEKVNLRLNNNKNLNESYNEILNDKDESILILEDNNSMYSSSSNKDNRQEKYNTDKTTSTNNSISSSTIKDIEIENSNEIDLNSTININSNSNKLEIIPQDDPHNLEKNVEPYVTNDNKVIYLSYTGKENEIVNWNRARFYTVLDIKNSPLREIFIKQMKMVSNNNPNC